MVYLGRLEGAAGFSKPVVIKQVLSHLDGDAESKAQFAREARILSELQHPGIVGVLDFGEESDSYVMVLEYVHGFHLGQWLKYVSSIGEGFDWQFAALAVIRVLEAIQYAHTRTDPEGRPRAIIHRDISPGNVLIDVQGNVRLVDFGIATATGEAREFETKDGVVKGKLSFIAPEIYGSGAPSAASDVYAVGVVLYQLLSGKNPFMGKHMSDTISRVLNEVPPRISTLRPSVPPELDDVLSRAMAKLPENRFSTALEMCTALRELLPRPEAEVIQDFQQRVAKDFRGDLSRVLKVLPLSELDAAWRESGHDPESERPLLFSSLPPSLSGEATDADITVPPDEDEEATRTGSAVARELQVALELDRVLATPALESTETDQAPPTERKAQSDTLPDEPALSVPPSTKRAAVSTKMAVITIAGAGLVAALAAGAVIGFGGSTTVRSDKPRYLLVERTSQPEAAKPSPAANAVPPKGESSQEEKTVAKTNKTEAPAKAISPNSDAAQPNSDAGRKKLTGVAALTQAFAQRQSSVQSCFSSHAGALKGSPEISIRFEVDAAGQVDAAQVRPAAVAATSLGQCLSQVARGTSFPGQGKAVAFSIPIRARTVSP